MFQPVVDKMRLPSLYHFMNQPLECQELALKGCTSPFFLYLSTLDTIEDFISIFGLFLYGSIELDINYSLVISVTEAGKPTENNYKTYQDWWIRSLKPMSGMSGQKNSRVAKPRVGCIFQTDHGWV